MKDVKKKKKMQNAKLEHYLTRPHAIPHKVFAFIYILIDID